MYSDLRIFCFIRILLKFRNYYTSIALILQQYTLKKNPSCGKFLKTLFKSFDIGIAMW